MLAWFRVNDFGSNGLAGLMMSRGPFLHFCICSGLRYKRLGDVRSTHNCTGLVFGPVKYIMGPRLNVSSVGTRGRYCRPGGTFTKNIL